MARYYGTIQGARGPASRLGSPASGLAVTAQSYNGDIVVNFQPGPGKASDEDLVHIAAREHGGWTKLVLYDGPVHALLAPSARLTFTLRAVKHLTTEDKAELFRRLGDELMAQ